MKKILLSLILFLSFLNAVADNSPTHALLSATRILSFYPFYGEQDELCWYQEQELESIIDILILNEDSNSLRVLWIIMDEINKIRDFYFIQYLADKVLWYLKSKNMDKGLYETNLVFSE